MVSSLGYNSIGTGLRLTWSKNPLICFELVQNQKDPL